MQKLFKEAAKIAAVVPESMQEAAFHRALDLLTRNAPTPNPTATPRRASKQRTSADGDTESCEGDRVTRVMAVSRDQALEVDQETSVQGRSIALLVAASREADVDGLTAPEIAKVLTEKFRHRTTRQAVQQAMDTAGNMVDRRKSGSDAALYRVMKPGTEWLATPADQRTAASSRKRSSRRPTGRKAVASSAAKPATANKTPTGANKGGAAARPTGAGRKTGPKAVLDALISEGYFSEPRGMADIKQHIRDQKATSFASTDLSPALTRLLREGKLKRSRAEKQYVYTAG